MKHLRTVGDVMTHAVVSVGREAPFREIVNSMRQWRISALPVLSDEGRVVGVVSEADLLVRAQGEDTSGALTAGSLMSVPAVTIVKNAKIAGAARLMAREHLKRLPVVDADGRLVGVVSRGDLLKIYLRPDDDIAEEVRSSLLPMLPAGSSDLAVQVESGIVTVTGTLPERALVDALTQVARAVPGVVDVHTRLSVQQATSYGR